MSKETSGQQPNSHPLCGAFNGVRWGFCRAREQDSEKRKAAAAEKWATTRAAAEEARRRREEEVSSMRDAAGGKIAELESRAASFRQRQKVVRRLRCFDRWLLGWIDGCVRFIAKRPYDNW